MRASITALFAGLIASSLGSFARAEVFVLRNDGQVRGELVNKDESPRRTYVIKTTTGGEITLDKSQVKQVLKQTEAEKEYEQIRGDYADTVDGQWNLAEWCLKKHLTKQRKTHLARVIELDANHAGARKALGYFQAQGQWVTQEKLMTDRGYIKYRGGYKLPQEIELIEQKEKDDLAQKEWFAKLKRWRVWLSDGRASQAETAIAAITDPAAVKAITYYLSSESDRDLKLLLIDALAHIGAPSALEPLVKHSLDDSDEEVRLRCLDLLAEKKYRAAVATYVQRLKSKDNAVINRAAVGLSHMKDPSAIGPLINALVTTHTYKIVKQQPGMTAGFSGVPGRGFGNGGLSMGGSNTEIIKKTLTNQDVLDALVVLSGGTNFNFDTQAWRYWYARQKKTDTLDARRDEAKR